MKIYLPEENYEENYDTLAVPYLSAHQTADDVFLSFDGRALHYEVYQADDPKGTLTILHGFTESIVKFLPLTYVFLNEGYNVCLLDQRGHGKSFRYVENPSLTHIEKFEEYVKDLEAFTDKVVSALPGPHFLFAHSMGGGVSAEFLETGTDFYTKAVLSSPMIEPAHAGVPLPVAKMIFGGMVLAGKKQNTLFNRPDYTGQDDFESSCATSRARFDWYSKRRQADRNLYNYNPSVGWANESMKVRGVLLKKGAPEAIRIPVLLFSCDNDNMVLRPAQEAFIKRVKQGRFVTVANAKHEIYRSTDEVLYPYLETILKFFEE